MLKQLLISSIICSPALCDEPAGRVRRGSAGGDGDVHVSSCWSANAYHQLETQLGTHSTQQQVGLMFFFYILLSSPGGNRKFSPTVSFEQEHVLHCLGKLSPIKHLVKAIPAQLIGSRPRGFKNYYELAFSTQFSPDCFK